MSGCRTKQDKIIFFISYLCKYLLTLKPNDEQTCCHDCNYLWVKLYYIRVYLVGDYMFNYIAY